MTEVNKKYQEKKYLGSRLIYLQPSKYHHLIRLLHLADGKHMKYRKQLLDQIMVDIIHGKYDNLKNPEAKETKPFHSSYTLAQKANARMKKFHSKQTDFHLNFKNFSQFINAIIGIEYKKAQSKYKKKKASQSSQPKDKNEDQN